MDKIESIIIEVERDCRMRGIPLLGPHKARFLAEQVRRTRPRVAVECGTAIGYSGLWILKAMRDSGGGRLLTFEIDPRRAKEAKRNFARAEVDDMVEIRVGDARNLLGYVKDSVDFLFLDNNYPNYLPCFRAIEPRLRDGAIVVADNAGIGGWGMRDYLNLVRSRYKSTLHWFEIDLPWGNRDAMEVTIFSRMPRADHPKQFLP
ncbi:MAG: O-methyltransferase [bacterium]